MDEKSLNFREVEHYEMELSINDKMKEQIEKNKKRIEALQKQLDILK